MITPSVDLSSYRDQHFKVITLLLKLFEVYAIKRQPTHACLNQHNVMLAASLA
jgi:hypothetical protein